MDNKSINIMEPSTRDLLNLAVEQNTSSVLITDISGNIKYANPKFSYLTGYSFEEVVDKNPRILSSGEKSKEEYKKLWDTILSGKEWRGEFRNKKKNNELYWVYAVITPIKNKVGQITHFLGIAEDITEKKMRADAFKATEEKYLELIENSAFAVFISDYNGNFKLVNAEACRILGYTYEEFKFLNFIDTYPDNKTHDFINNLEIIRNAGVHIYERNMKRKDGSIFPAELTIRLTRDNDFQAIVKDLSFQEEAEEKIRFQANLLDQVGQAVLATNMDGKITYINRTAEELYSIKKDSGLGKNIYEFFFSDSFKEVDKEILAVTSKGRIWKNEFIVEQSDNSKLTTFLTVNPIYDTSGTIIGKVGISFDLSEQKKKEMELLKAKQKAEEMNRLKSNFLANMSHELRTPLVGILGFSEILKQEEMEPHQKEMLDDILESGKRLLNTLKLLLEFSQVESQKIEIKISELDLCKIIEENIGHFKDKAKIKNLPINFKIEVVDFKIKSDKKIINTILSNLLDNAIKFTFKGNITISLFRETIKNSEYAVISVSDTGIGISPDDQEIIFEEFRQVAEGISRPFEGTGLGLSLTKKYLSLLNGIISLKSVSGSGSTFYIYLPIKNSHPETEINVTCCFKY